MNMNELKSFLASDFDGFEVHVDPSTGRADVVLNRPPLNVIEMSQRDELRTVFEALDRLPEIRIIVLRSAGEHFSSGGNIKGFLEASPEHVSKLADNVAAPARCVLAPSTSTITSPARRPASDAREPACT